MREEATHLGDHDEGANLEEKLRWALLIKQIRCHVPRVDPAKPVPLSFDEREVIINGRDPSERIVRN